MPNECTEKEQNRPRGEDQSEACEGEHRVSGDLPKAMWCRDLEINI